jgi:opacity protein-like surface antigen
MRSMMILAGAAALLASAQTVSAQTPAMALEVRGTFDIPSGDWNDEELFDNGFGGGATLTVMVGPQMGIYGGWELVRFPLDEDELGVDADADGTDAGFRAGLASFVPIASMPSVTPFTELGVIYNTFEISASDGDNSAGIESEWGLGYEAGVGVAIQAAPRLDVTPIIRYRAHDVEFEDFEGGDTVQYFSFGVGVRVRL